MRIAIGSDHGGFELKKKLITYLESLEYEVRDFGTYTPDSVDYPDIAAIVGFEIAKGNFPYGILIDGIGIGSAIAANKIQGIRAATCNNLFMAESARLHNNANIIVFGAGQTGDVLAKEMVKKFLETKFSGGRHERRVNKIIGLEEANLKEVEKYTAPPKRLITGDDIRLASRSNEKVVYYEKAAIITELAKEIAFDLGVRIVER